MSYTISLNSPQAIARAKRHLWHYGSWDAVRRAGFRKPEGGLVVPDPPSDCICGCQQIVIPPIPPTLTQRIKQWFLAFKQTA